MTLKLRPTKPKDLPDLVKIHKACFSSPYDPPWSFQQFRQTLCQDTVHSFCVVSEAESDLIRGFGIFQKSSDFSELLTLAISPCFQRQGAAKFLLVHVFEDFKDFFLPCFLEVGSLNYKAIALYKQFDFVEVGRRKNYYQVFGISQTDDALVLKKG